MTNKPHQSFARKQSLVFRHRLTSLSAKINRPGSEVQTEAVILVLTIQCIPTKENRLYHMTDLVGKRSFTIAWSVSTKPARLR